MNLHKEAINTGGNASSRKMRNVLRLPTRALPLSAGELQTLSHVKHHRAFQTLHNGKAAEIDHKIVVSERHATLRQQQSIVARLAHFLDDVLHLPWRQKLALFHIHDLSGPGGRNNEVCLAREECGNLKNVEDFACGLALRRFVHVGQNGYADLLAHLSENLQSLAKARTAERFDRCAIGLVVRSFENQGNTAGGCDLLQLEGHEHDMLPAFDNARTRDEKKITGKVETKVR